MADHAALIAEMDQVLTRPTASATDVERLLELATHDAAPVRAHAVDTLSATVEYFDLAPRLIEIGASPEVNAVLVTILEELTADGWPKRPDAEDLAATGPRVIWQISDHLDDAGPLPSSVQARLDAVRKARP